MNHRFQLGVKGATPHLDYDGILATLVVVFPNGCLGPLRFGGCECLFKTHRTAMFSGGCWKSLNHHPLVEFLVVVRGRVSITAIGLST
jgi:hypothetical protein